MKRLTDYSDLTATRQVIGCIMQKPGYIKQYNIVENDFAEKLYQYVFSAIEHLHNNGAKLIDTVVIMDYLQQYKVQYKNFQHNNGQELLLSIEEGTDIDNFEYNISIVKKFALLRDYTRVGIDVSDFFNPDDYEFAVQEKKRKLLEDTSIKDIMLHFQAKTSAVNEKYRCDVTIELNHIDDSESYLSSLKENAYGIGFASEYLNTITHGQQRGKLYLCSAGSGVGKSRNLIAHMCYGFVPELYCSTNNSWTKTNTSTQNKGLYIGTEMDIKTEVLPIVLAYISDVHQDKIMCGKMTKEELERVNKAIDIFNQKRLILKDMPDYSLSDLETFIRDKVKRDNVTHVYLDYIHTSPELLSEFSEKSGKISGLREDQVLANVSKVLKDLARELNICIITATQITGEADKSDRTAQLIRGSKAIVDKVDVGIIFTRPTKEEKNAWVRGKMPTKANLVYNIYKNRGGEYNNLKIVLSVDYRTMRIKDLFVVDMNNIEVKDVDGFPLFKTRIGYNDDGKLSVKASKNKEKVA